MAVWPLVITFTLSIEGTEAPTSQLTLYQLRGLEPLLVSQNWKYWRVYSPDQIILHCTLKVQRVSWGQLTSFSIWDFCRPWQSPRSSDPTSVFQNTELSIYMSPEPIRWTRASGLKHIIKCLHFRRMSFILNLIDIWWLQNNNVNNRTYSAKNQTSHSRFSELLKASSMFWSPQMAYLHANL